MGSGSRSFDYCHMCTGVVVPLLARPLVRGAGNLDSLGNLGTPENISEGTLKVGVTLTHVNGDRTSDRTHGETEIVEWVKISSCSTSIVEGSRVAGGEDDCVFQNLSLTTEDERP